MIGNYRDNRFNGLFQTSAEIMLHADDMIDVLNTVHQPNRKLISVKADLQCCFVQTLLQCLGLCYLKITGPYWNLVMSNSVPYVLLHTHIKSLVDYLNRCVIKPELLLSRKEHWDNSDRVSDLPGR